MAFARAPQTTDRSFMVAHVIDWDPPTDDGPGLARTEFLAVTEDQLAELIGVDAAVELLATGKHGDDWMLLA